MVGKPGMSDGKYKSQFRHASAILVASGWIEDSSGPQIIAWSHIPWALIDLYKSKTTLKIESH